MIQTVSLSDICTKITSGGTPLTKRDDYYGGGIPWLRTQEVNFGNIYSTEKTITELGLKNSSAKNCRWSGLRDSNRAGGNINRKAAAPLPNIPRAIHASRVKHATAAVAVMQIAAANPPHAAAMPTAPNRNAAASPAAATAAAAIARCAHWCSRITALMVERPVCTIVNLTCIQAKK